MTESASALSSWESFYVIVGCGLGGLAYGALVVHRARQTDYEPVWEDWLWYAVLPCVSYAAGLTALRGCARRHSLK